jgi:hypothetical protein
MNSQGGNQNLAAATKAESSVRQPHITFTTGLFPDGASFDQNPQSSETPFNGVGTTLGTPDSFARTAISSQSAESALIVT